MRSRVGSSSLGAARACSQPLLIARSSEPCSAGSTTVQHCSTEWLLTAHSSGQPWQEAALVWQGQLPSQLPYVAQAQPQVQAPVSSTASPPQPQLQPPTGRVMAQASRRASCGCSSWGLRLQGGG